jgi:predicted outer membrane protein
MGIRAGEIMYSDYEKRLEALYEQTSKEKDPDKLKQLISEILALLEAHQQHLRDREAEPSDDKG